MDRRTFDELVQQTIKETAQLLIEKGAEYAGDVDRLVNFKRGAQHIGVTPLQIALIYTAKHFDAISTYIKKDALGEEQILSEPIEGRLNDLVNYAILIKALIQESNEDPLKRFK